MHIAIALLFLVLAACTTPPLPSTQGEISPAATPSATPSNQSNSSEDDAYAPAATVQSEPGDFIAEIGVTQQETGTGTHQLVLGGVPFGRGVISDPDRLRLHGASGASVPLQSRVLALWPDRSIRWAELAFLAELNPPPGRSKFSLSVADVAAAGSTSVPLATPAKDVLFELTDAAGKHKFKGTDSVPFVEGAIYSEGHESGYFGARSGEISAAVTVAHFPGLRAYRYQVELEQLVNGATWSRLSVRLPHPKVTVRRQKEMGATIERSSPSGTSTVTLIGDTTPADAGVGRRWEIWAYDDPELFNGVADRPQPSPRYYQETGALGLMSLEPPRSWEQNFVTSADRLYREMSTKEVNLGWRHYGDYYIREEDNIHYYGYSDQEYDPGTAFFLGYARTGDLQYLDIGLDTASHYRDMCTSPEGGLYQHRATNHTVLGYLVSLLQEKIERQVKGHAKYRPNSNGLRDAIVALYGNKIPGLRSKISVGLSNWGNYTHDEQLYRATERIALAVVQNPDRRRERPHRTERKRYGMKAAVEVLLSEPRMAHFGLADPDEVFAPFFDRYGGSWSDFPAFHVDMHPNPRERHTGGHSLVEMVVLGYFFSGDEGYRTMAARIAEHQTSIVIPQAIDTLGENIAKGSKKVRARQVAWPLINLVALHQLTQEQMPELNEAVERVAKRAAHTLASIPPDAYEGGIHVGVTVEALARYHEWTGDPKISEYLPRLAKYWARTQWSSRRNAFLYKRDDQGAANERLTALVLYGLAYAHDLEPNRELRDRILQAQATLMREVPVSTKGFAMHYRSMPRTLGITEAWE